jgi:hypothetical protein
MEVILQRISIEVHMHIVLKTDLHWSVTDLHSMDLQALVFHKPDEPTIRNIKISICKDS